MKGPTKWLSLHQRPHEMAVLHLRSLWLVLNESWGSQGFQKGAQICSVPIFVDTRQGVWRPTFSPNNKVNFRKRLTSKAPRNGCPSSEVTLVGLKWKLCSQGFQKGAQICSVPIFVDGRQGGWRPTFSPNNKVNFGERLTLKAPRNGCPSSEVTLVGLKWKLRSQGFQKGAQICSVPIFVDGRQGGWRPTFSPNNKVNFGEWLTSKAPRNGCPSSQVTLVGLKRKLRSQWFQKGAQICSVPIFVDGRQGGWRPTFSPNNKVNFRKRLTSKAPRNGCPSSEVTLVGLKRKLRSQGFQKGAQICSVPIFVDGRQGGWRPTFSPNNKVNFGERLTSKAPRNGCPSSEVTLVGLKWKLRSQGFREMVLKYVPVPIFVDGRQGGWRPTFSPNNKVNFGERLTLKAPRNGCPSSEVTLVGLKWKLRSQGFQKWSLNMFLCQYLWMEGKEVGGQLFRLIIKLTLGSGWHQRPHEMAVLHLRSLWLVSNESWGLKDFRKVLKYVLCQYLWMEGKEVWRPTFSPNT